MDYTIEKSTGVQGLIDVVQALLKKDVGWEPIGGPFWDGKGSYCQALVKDDENDFDEEELEE